jgi:hypothetical protein
MADEEERGQTTDQGKKPSGPDAGGFGDKVQVQVVGPDGIKQEVSTK